MNSPELKTIEDIVTDESFLNFYFQKNEDALLDWEDWQEDMSERKVLVGQAFKLLDTLSLKLNYAYIELKTNELHRKLTLEIVATPDRPRRYIGWRVAASLAILMVVGSWFIWKKSLNTEGGIATVAPVIENVQAGKIKIYNLKDGSTVRLNVGSQLRLADGFGKTNRDVFLKGEAFFEVKKSTALRFRVHTEGSITTAVGTAFSVRALAGEKVKVVLVEGKVRVQNTARDATTYVELTAGQEARFDKTEMPKVETSVNIAAATRWKDGYVLTFRETPFAEVCRVLSENYKVELSGFEQMDLMNAKITAEFDKSMPIESVMEALAFANDFNFSIKNETIKILKN